MIKSKQEAFYKGFMHNLSWRDPGSHQACTPLTTALTRTAPGGGLPDARPRTHSTAGRRPASSSPAPPPMSRPCFPSHGLLEAGRGGRCLRRWVQVAVWESRGTCPTVGLESSPLLRGTAARWYDVTPSARDAPCAVGPPGWERLSLLPPPSLAGSRARHTPAEAPFPSGATGGWGCRRHNHQDICSLPTASVAPSGHSHEPFPRPSHAVHATRPAS